MNLRRFIPARIPTILAVAFLTVQIAIPTMALFGDRPARWGWQMFSGSRTLTEFVMVRKDGTTAEINPTDYLGKGRSELDLSETLPAFICEQEPGATSVRVTDLPSDTTSEIPCER